MTGHARPSAFEPTAPAQHAKARARRLPETDEVRDGIWSVPLPMPGGNIPFSLCYLVLDAEGGVHVIDPGVVSDDGWRLLEDALARAGRSLEDVRSVVCTHLHADHTAMAAGLRERSGARVVMHEAEAAAMTALRSGGVGILGGRQAEAWGVPAARRGEVEDVLQMTGPAPFVEVDATVRAGDLLDVPGRELEVLWTPGHTGGHVCLRERGERLLFTGDHVLPMINSGLGLGGPTATNPLADYLASLTAVAAFDDHEVCPGHGYRFRGLARRCAELAAHQTRRAREVEAVLAGDGGDGTTGAAAPSVWAVASRLTWTAGWDGLTGFYLASALAQTAMLAEYASLQQR
ncbi:MBL fold metallo-hydrolase [Cellulomonas sp. PhB143]|uniref:MBL fold metallo-hydrolase n=1 Tax=Cellulomonas sp. PhB143 TaxID=2485186 RepID=UPI000F4675B0|nr:MBL fold metallo-hydrolase [Cellulomonas sp. PhB143]ROS73609.1 glyoxylase-like metal-dependent hydrolase (beta-lactamase superfamily II) [Cellulomonas sp. PhB143]